MDRLNVMKSFVTVADHGSFSGAAKTLGTSASLISRHIADLEDQVGVRLVNRTARSISLTEPGRRYSEFARRVLAEIEHEDREIGGLQDRPEGLLSIVCPKWIGSLDLGDAIAEFSVRYPRITIRFELGGVSDRSYDFLDEGFDIGFRTRDLRDSGVRLKRVTILPFVLCASPLYLKRHGDIVEPNELGERDCLVHVNQPVWRIGEGESSSLHKVKNTAFLSNSYIALTKAAVAGRGIGLLPLRAVIDDLNKGTLVPVLTGYPIPGRSLYAITSPDAQMPLKVKVFLDFLVTWFKQNPLALLPMSDG